MNLFRKCLMIICFSTTQISCIVSIGIEIQGKIENYNSVKNESITFAFDDFGSFNMKKVNPVFTDSKGSFRLFKGFFNTVPQTVMLLKNDTIIDRFIILSDIFQRKDSLILKNPITDEVFSYKITEDNATLKVEGVEFRPKSDSLSLSKLNVEKLLLNISYSDSLIIFTFSEIPPRGSKILLWGQKWNEGSASIDTVFEIKNKKIYFDNTFFKDHRDNLFQGGRIIFPYGWFKPFLLWEIDSSKRRKL